MPRAKIEKPMKKKVVGFSVPAYSLDGKEVGVLELPKELFGAKVNEKLLTQAIRVYLNNLKGHSSNTKTRAEVRGSTRKVYRQKGTGGARHGSIRAPIYVGGGIALGPKFRKVVLDLPKKMKKAALVSALSSKMAEKEIIGINLDKVSGKTAQMRDFLKKIGKQNALIVLDSRNDNVSHAVGNLPKVDTLPAEQLNALEVIKHQTLILTKEAVGKLKSKKEESKGRG